MNDHVIAGWLLLDTEDCADRLAINRNFWDLAARYSYNMYLDEPFHLVNKLRRIAFHNSSRGRLFLYVSLHCWYF